MVTQVTGWVELIIAFMMVMGFLALAVTRILNYYSDERSSGLTTGVIRYTSVVLIVPIMAILTLEGVIGAQSLMAIYGTIVGYTLAGFDV